MPYRIGLTGNIARGKSTVGRLLVARGAELDDLAYVPQSWGVGGRRPKGA